MPEENADDLDRPALVTRVTAWLNERWRNSLSASGFLRLERPPFSIASASAIDAAQRLSHRYGEVRMNVRNLYGATEDGFAGVRSERFGGATGNNLFNLATWAIQKEWNARFFEPEQSTARTVLKGILTACRSTNEDASRRGNELLDKLKQTTIEPDYGRVIYGLFDELVQYFGIYLLAQPDATHAPQYIALDAMAARVMKGKRTLERYKTKGKLPPPDVEGGGGKADLWIWANIRPWLEETFGMALPSRLPEPDILSGR